MLSTAQSPEGLCVDFFPRIGRAHRPSFAGGESAGEQAHLFLDAVLHLAAGAVELLVQVLQIVRLGTVEQIDKNGNLKLKMDSGREVGFAPPTKRFVGIPHSSKPF